MKKAFLIVFLLAGSCYGLQAQNKLDIDFKTGDDNLETKEFQENPEVRIIVKDKPDIIKTNINYRGSTWPNNSIRRVTIPLPDGVAVEELMEIHVYRRPVYDRKYAWDYLVKDNWTLKALTVTATFNAGEEKKQYELLKLVPRGNVFRFIYEKGDSIREGTFFKAPLSVKAEMIEKPETTLNAVVTAVIGTGNDNLEGGNDNNVNLILYLRNSPAAITIENLNGSRKWNNRSENNVTREIPNSEALNIMDIERVVVKHTGGGGTFADNWDMNKLRLTISKGTEKRLLVNEIRYQLHRFTGEAREKSFDVAGIQGQAALNNATITAVFGTGSDNLEGGNSNNVSIILHLESPTRVLTISNVNNRATWGNNTVRTVQKEITRSHDIDIANIKKVELKHTGGGGLYADNWNLDKFKLTITHKGQTKVLIDEVRVPIHRFTGDSRTKQFIVE
jgi:hypothetical protein